MTIVRKRVGDVLRLERVPVAPDPTVEYTSIGIRSFGKGLFHYEPKPGDQLGSLRFFQVLPDRLVVSNIKGWEGAIAVSSHVDAGCVASNRFLSYRPVDDRIDVRWARWFFLSERGIELIQRASPGSADRNRTLAMDRFEALEIPLPPIEDQRRQRLYLNAVAGWANAAADSFGRQDVDCLIELLPALVDSVIERAAIGRARVGDLAEFISDTVHPGDDPAPAESFVGLQHIESHTGRCLGSDELGNMKGRKFRFRPGDVIYGYLRPYLNKVWVADRHGLCSVDQYVLRPHPSFDAKILGHGLRGGAILSQAIDLTHSLQLPRLRSGLLAALEVPTIGEGGAASVVPHLDRLRDQLLAAKARRRLQTEMAAALVPSAMNEVFASLS